MGWRGMLGLSAMVIVAMGLRFVVAQTPPKTMEPPPLVLTTEVGKRGDSGSPQPKPFDARRGSQQQPIPTVQRQSQPLPEPPSNKPAPAPLPQVPDRQSKPTGPPTNAPASLPSPTTDSPASRAPVPASNPLDDFDFDIDPTIGAPDPASALPPTTRDAYDPPSAFPDPTDIDQFDLPDPPTFPNPSSAGLDTPDPMNNAPSTFPNAQPPADRPADTIPPRTEDPFGTPPAFDDLPEPTILEPAAGAPQYRPDPTTPAPNRSVDPNPFPRERSIDPGPPPPGRPEPLEPSGSRPVTNHQQTDPTRPRNAPRPVTDPLDRDLGTATTPETPPTSQVVPLRDLVDRDFREAGVDPAVRLSAFDGNLSTNILPSIDPNKFESRTQEPTIQVKVESPETLIYQRESVIGIAVENLSRFDLHEVYVREVLSSGFEFIDSNPTLHVQPEQNGPDGSQILTWKLGTMRARANQSITLKVKPVRPGPFSHNAAVYFASGTQRRVEVQQPKLEVIPTFSRKQLLQGDESQLEITIKNPGTGPARDVNVVVDLGYGLVMPSEDGKTYTRIEPLVPIEELPANGQHTLPPLTIQGIADGEPKVTITATSEDVVLEESPDHQVVSTLQVLTPKITLDISGPTQRFTNSQARYSFVLRNDGTAEARNVRLVVEYPEGAEVISSVPDNPQPSDETRYLFWTIPQLKAQSDFRASFNVRFGNKAQRDALVRAVSFYDTENELDLTIEEVGLRTEIQGIVDFQIDLSDEQKAIDIGGTTRILATIINNGTKTAEDVAIQIEVDKKILTLTGKGFGTHTSQSFNALAKSMQGEHEVIPFPMIPRIEPGEDITLSVEAEGIRKGTGLAIVKIQHKDLENDAYEAERHPIYVVGRESER